MLRARNRRYGIEYEYEHEHEKQPEQCHSLRYSFLPMVRLECTAEPMERAYENSRNTLHEKEPVATLYSM